MHIRNVLLSIFCLPIFSPTTNAQQIPIQTTPATPAAGVDYTPQKHTGTKPSLADLLTIESAASIFYTYARETELSSRLIDENSQLTIFVPTNKAVMALARKPHQGPDSESKVSQSEFDRRAKRNVERWVSAHMVPEYPLSFDSNPHQTLLAGKSISFLQVNEGGSGPEWKNVVLDNKAKVIKKKEGSNGDLYFIDGAISID